MSDIDFFSITQNPATSDGVFNVVGTIGLTTKVAARALISKAHRRSPARLSLVVEPTAVGSNPLGADNVGH